MCPTWTLLFLELPFLLVIVVVVVVVVVWRQQRVELENPPSITRGGRLVEHFAVQSLMEGWMRFYILLNQADYLKTSLLRHIGCCHKGQESKTKALSHLVTVY